MLSYKEACELLCKQFPDSKVVGCSENDKYYYCSIVDLDDVPVERKGLKWYSHCDCGWKIDKKTGEIISLSSMPDDVMLEWKKYGESKIIFYELDDGYAYWLGKD